MVDVADWGMSGPYDFGWVAWLIVVGISLATGAAAMLVKELMSRRGPKP